MISPFHHRSAPKRRWRWALLLTASLLGLGCGQNLNPAVCGIVGIRDISLVGDRLFMTSTDRADLRVLGLADKKTDCIRAPNPVEPLSIPVLDRPVALVRDINYDSNGQEVSGPYLYVQGAADAQISVVATDPSLLLEKFRIPTAGVVTAMAARGPGILGGSTLYYATADSVGPFARSTLWRVSVPSSQPIPAPTALSVSLPGETITSVVLLPSVVSNGQLLTKVAIAVRGSGMTGRTFLWDETSGASVPLNFPYPVKSMITNPRAPNRLGEGRKIYGVLDESTCPAQTNCAGVLAVDTCISRDGAPDLEQPPPNCQVGQISKDDSTSGTPVDPPTMLTLYNSPAFITGLTLAPTATVNGMGTFPLLGIITATLGGISFFDAVGMRQIDTGTGGATSTLIYRLANGSTVPAVGGPDPSTIALTKGTTRDENVTITYQGKVLDRVPVNFGSDQRRFLIPGAMLGGRAQPGDTVQLINSDSSTDPCNLELPIDVVGTDFVITHDPVPPQCNPATFAVRAIASQSGLGAYVVFGSVTGYMGRTGPGMQFAFRGTDYFHAPGYTPSQLQLGFTFGSEDPAVARDNYYFLQIGSGFAPFNFSVATGTSDYTIPGSVAYHPPLGRAYIAFPSANSVVEMSPSTALPSVSNANIVIYR